jgi:hypothetical protein
MRPRLDIIERQLKGLIKSHIALSSQSLGGSNIKYGKRLFRYRLHKWMNEPDFEQEVEKRRYRYAGMEYQRKGGSIE